MSGKKDNIRSVLIFLALLALGLGGGLGGLHWLGVRAEASDGLVSAKGPPPLAMPPSGAYVQGGRPTTTGPARDVFLVVLPDFVIALDRWGRDVASDPSAIREDLQEPRGAVLASAHKAGMPLQAIERLQTLLDACLVAAISEGEDLDSATDDVVKRTLSLNDALATAGLGFFVDAEVLSHGNGTSVLLFSFEVHRVVLYRSQGHDVRTLRIRRLDNLNWTYSLLGFTAPQRRDAVVLDNKVEEHLLELLPILSLDTRIDPFDLVLKDTYAPWYTETRNRASAVVAEELGKAGPDVAELGALIAERHEIYREWNVRLESRRASIAVPKRLEVTWDYRQQMEGLATHAAMDKLDAIQKKLGEKKMQQAFALAQDHLAQSVERHETQHRLDLAKLYTLPMPEELSRYVGELPKGYRGEGGLASSALAETSAYLSELARDPLTPRTNLTLLARYLLNRRAWGMGESYAALVIFGGLAHELAVVHEPLVSGRSINRSAVAGLYMAFTDLDSDALQDASMMLWARLFKTELPELELVAR